MGFASACSPLPWPVVVRSQASAAAAFTSSYWKIALKWTEQFFREPENFHNIVLLESLKSQHSSRTPTHQLIPPDTFHLSPGGDSALCDMLPCHPARHTLLWFCDKLVLRANDKFRKLLSSECEEQTQKVVCRVSWQNEVVSGCRMTRDPYLFRVARFNAGMDVYLAKYPNMLQNVTLIYQR